MPVRCVRVFGSPVQGESCTGHKAFLRLPQGGRIGYLSKKINPQKKALLKRGEIRKQAKSLKSSRLWTAGKQVTTE